MKTTKASAVKQRIKSTYFKGKGKSKGKEAKRLSLKSGESKAGQREDKDEESEKPLRENSYFLDACFSLCS